MPTQLPSTRLIVLLALVVSAALAAPLAAQEPASEPTTRPAAAGPVDPAKEPPQEFVLELGGKRTEVVAEQPFEIEVAGQTVRGRLTPRPARLFTTGEVSFQYPNDFAFDYDPTGEAPSWELDGSDTVITLLRYDAAEKPQELVEVIADGIAEDSDNGSAKTKPTSIRLDGRAVRGKRVTSTLLETKFRQDVYGFTAGGHTYVLMIQDSLTETGAPSAEGVEAVALLTKTFKIATKPATAPSGAP